LKKSVSFAARKKIPYLSSSDLCRRNHYTGDVLQLSYSLRNVYTESERKLAHGLSILWFIVKN